MTIVQNKLGQSLQHLGTPHFAKTNVTKLKQVGQ